MTTSPMPMPGYAAEPAGPQSGWAGVPTPAAVESGFAPVRRRRLDPAQIWTLVVTGVIAVVATVVGITASGGDAPSREDQVRQLLDDAGLGGYSSSYEEDSDCYDVYC